MTLESDEYDAVVGENLRRLRVAKELNQEQLAEALAERGLAFRQQTVAKVEGGHRPLRLREADAIAAVLEVDIDTLVAEEIVMDFAARTIKRVEVLNDRWEALIEATKEFLLTQEYLRHDLEQIEKRNIAVPDSVMSGAATLLQVDPEDTVRGVPGLIAAERALLDAKGAIGVEWVHYERRADG